MGAKPVTNTEKLILGPVDYSFLPAVPAVPGTGVINGPLWIGAAGPPIPLANCMIGPGIANPISLQIIGITNHYGIYNRIAISNVTGLTAKIGMTLRAALSATTGINVKSALNAGSAVNVFKTIICDTVCTSSTFVGNISPTVGINPTIAAAIATKKSFDIPHPTKENYRLRHICLEGPSAEVYVRGKSKSNVIALPEYWRGLVDPESITVSLTSVGQDQNLYVKNIDDNLVYIGGGITIQGQKHFDFHYTIFAERRDVEKNIAEYKGLTPADYPGDNNEYTINDNK
tara:strand:- start:244 stop:1104 length:861 start_codon:yes stop_codon:yes gene_type:complete